MPSFRALEIWTDLACNAGVRVASFDRSKLAAATVKYSLTGQESLDFIVSRADDSIAELVHGRVARVCWSGTAYDTEWRLADDTQQSGEGDQGQAHWIASSLLLDLGRAPYVTWDAAGAASFAVDASQLTATEYITTYVIPAIDESDLFPVTVGTIDFTNDFDLTGDYQTALELLRAITEAGRAPGELVLRRNGSTDYQIDILTARGSTANTVRVQKTRNLLQNTRRRVLVSVGTKIMPRAASDAVVRDMGRTYWRIASVDSGTTATLENPLGGDGPITFDDQLNGLYVAYMTSTFSSQVVSDSVAATQQITVASTAGWAADGLVEFRRTSGSTGQRVVSLSHPTRSLAPTSGGYGARTLILDVPGLPEAAANLVPNPWAREWSNHSNPPDGWSGVALVTYSYETDHTQYGGASYKAVPAGASAIIASPMCYPYTTASLVYSFHAWCWAISGTITLKLMSENLLTTYVTGASYASGPANLWVQLSTIAQNLTALTSGFRVAVTNTGAGQIQVDAFSLAESAVAIPDTEYTGGLQLWTEANKRLASLSSPVAGYTVQLEDLERLDNSPWSDEPLVLGGNLEIIDTDLGDSTTQRLVEYAQDLLNPLSSTVQLANPDPLLTAALLSAV